MSQVLLGGYGRMVRRPRGQAHADQAERGGEGRRGGRVHPQQPLLRQRRNGQRGKEGGASRRGTPQIDLVLSQPRRTVLEQGAATQRPGALIIAALARHGDSVGRLWLEQEKMTNRSIQALNTG